jgi:hypothetical protein
VAGIGALAILPGAIGAVAGAAVSVVSEPMLDASTEAMIPPEVGGPRVLFRAAWPPAIAVIGLLPVVIAHRAEINGTPAVPVLLSTAVTVLALGSIVTAWVRFRSEIHNAIKGGTVTQGGADRGKAKR